MFEEIKKNIIDNYLNHHYRYSVVSCKKTLIENINNQIPFNVYSDDEVYNYINIDFGDNVIIKLNFIWEVLTDKNSTRYKLIKIS